MTKKQALGLVKKIRSGDLGGWKQPNYMAARNLFMEPDDYYFHEFFNSKDYYVGDIVANALESLAYSCNGDIA